MTHAFAAPLLDPGIPQPAGLVDARGNAAGRRFDVYRNNVTVSLIDALLVGFPVLTKLLGEENMRGLARLFARAHPPASPLMMFYGAEMADFLAGMAQLSHLPYLPDVARLEMSLRRSYHAADAAPIAPDLLASLAPEALMSATVVLAPSVIVLRSDWPIHDIWRFNTQSGAPKPAPGAQDVAVLRPEFDPEVVLLPPGAATWIDGLRDGMPFGVAVEAAVSGTPDFDLAAALSLLLSGGAITSITPDAQDAP